MSTELTAGSPGLQSISASKFLFVIFGTALILFVATLDRSRMLDEQAYLDYFSNLSTDRWNALFLDDELSAIGRAIIFFTEEILWLLWTAVAFLFFSPNVSIVITVLLLNWAIVRSCYALRNSNLALLVWVVVPAGLAAVGVMQIRQGFALGVLLYFAVVLGRPFLGVCLASLAHTTFLVAVPFVVAAWVFRNRPWYSISSCVAIAVAGALVAGLAFEMFGGRRLEAYAGDQAAMTINYVFGALICVLPSLERLLFEPEKSAVGSTSMNSLAAVHVGTTAFVITAFFFFPLASGRVGYMNYFMLIPILGAAKFERPTEITVMLVTGIAVIYFAARGLTDGAYAMLF